MSSVGPKGVQGLKESFFLESNLLEKEATLST